MIPTNYDPRTSEEKWYQYWLEHRFFHSTVDKKRTPYCIVIPPPNVTGVLHMGHMLNNTIQDVLVRRARLLGKNACWVPGTDHASIATEAKVVAKLKSEGIEKRDLSRDEFLKHAWAWTEKHGGIILEQLKRLGASCDWDRTCFTMDEIRSASVIKVFIDLYNKGLIYKGVRMVNWDPSAKTAVSDEEVVYKEEHSKLYYLRYRIDGTEDEYITIATTRPETILGDSAVCVNPNDERFRHLAGKKCIVPLVNRVIPIIQDEYVDMEFGTGALKITPAHDINDYEIGYKHHLETIDIFNDDGTLNENAQLFVGKDRFVVRQEIIPELEKAGNLVKIEDYNNKVGYSERTNVVIEPKLSMQWFLKMKELAKPALDAVMNDDILLTPAKYKNTYRYWMENVKDWCISRQLWWGHQIPVYYLPDSNDYVVAENITEAVRLVKEKFGQDITAEQLRQDEDCLDTWFSSWLWPISVFNGILEPDNEDINYYYPTNDLVSGPDILFFWMARMIMAGYEYRHEKPFSNLYLTGIVRDKLHRKMSKSLGNSPDPIDLINQYGADGVRVGMLLCAPAGGDLLFDESLPEQGRNFTTKIWNAFRLVSNWKVADLEQPLHSKLALEWFEQYLNKCKETLNTQFEQYRISEALMTVYTGFRDEFSSWLLEIIKPGFEQPIDRTTYDKTIYLFEEMLQLLHPFMPFITEEIWQNLRERKDGESIMVSVMPIPGKYDENFLNTFENMKEVIAGIRTIRKQNNIAFKDTISLRVKSNDRYPLQFENIIRKMGNIQDVEMVNDTVKGAWSFICDTVEYFIPAVGEVNTEEVRAKLQADLAYAQGFLASVMKKLSNEKFVSGAPAQVVENERKKQADAEAKIKAIEQQLAELN
ncbi:valine--tRNA ligase [Butyricimonas virosa]|jgi:valyl-tRNA synthetase|uniref:Valine--tRNA ligase n=2 Tax=Butyricimonas TaxID=574697 RepID=A0A415QG51_9BACT|nr:valine--tRNA ligase [Butyricimonas virosa]RHM41915.1 valine--tRNA ligase [Butyricimonas virosa]